MTDTRRIWLLIAAICVVYIVNYADRGAVALAAPLLKAELDLSATQYGLIVSAFFWVYAPAQLLMGWLADRWRATAQITLGLVLWSLATLLTGFAGGLLSLVVLRLLLGLGEAALPPAAIKLVAERVPLPYKERAHSSISLGIALGPLLGTLAGGALLVAFGWREMFFAFGIASLLLIAPWLWVLRHLPPPVPHPVTAAELPFGRILARRELWVASAIHFALAFGLYFLLTWLPLWLTSSKGYTIPQMTALTAGVFLAQAAGATATGAFADHRINAGANASHVRRALLTGHALLFALTIALLSAAGASALQPLLLLAAFCCGGASIFVFSFPSTLAGAPAAGRWLGVQNAIGNTSGMIGPVLTGAMLDAGLGYPAVFLMTAAVILVAPLATLILLPRLQPIDWR
jgi:MFS family permease